MKINSTIAMNRRNMLIMVPLFLGALAVGFLIEITTNTSSKIQQLQQANVHLEERFNRKLTEYKIFCHNLKPALDTTGSVDHNPDKKEQFENETKVIEDTTVELWKQPTLLNLDPFSWVMLNESLCAPDGDSMENIRILLVLLHTARSHFEERMAIRHSWGSIPIYKNWTVCLVFLMGEADMGSNPEANRKEFDVQDKRLIDEQNEFGDIVMGSFIDTYRNLTYKHLMGYKWVLNYCPNASFVFKADDDMFIDIMRILDWRTNDLEKEEWYQPDLYCKSPLSRKVLREKNSKWRVTEEEWSGSKYPIYCSGFAYGLTVDLIEKLYSVSNDMKYFWVDDVFATGALMKIVKKKYHWKPMVKDLWDFVSFDIGLYRRMCETNDLSLERKFPELLYVARGDYFERDMMCLWNKTLYDKMPQWNETNSQILAQNISQLDYFT